MIHHAGLLAMRLAEGWRGALIEGESGAGKSDLALRALDAGWSLIADDQTLLWVSGGRLWGRAPDPLAGLLEVRGLGVLPTAGRRLVEISLVVRCVTAEAMERLPNDETCHLLGVALPLVRLTALEGSAPAKLSRALTHIGLRH